MQKQTWDDFGDILTALDATWPAAARQTAGPWIIRDGLRDTNILISAHGNSIRALCKKLFELDNNLISNLEIPTGNPLLIKLDNNLKITKCEYLDKERAKDLLVF